jgi:5-methylcytosine-specific restriction endonuclease McrA
VTLDEEGFEEQHEHSAACNSECSCGRGSYPSCKYRSCYECFKDRLADLAKCILCGRWHSRDFDTCFKCRPQTRGRDDAAKALRQLILWRDQFTCQYCGAIEGELRVDDRLSRQRCRTDCALTHTHRIKDDDGLRHTQLQVDHIVPCAHGGRAVEWNLQVLCSVCNIAKGAFWHPGCRHDRARTALCRRYFMVAPSYFNEEDRTEFMEEVVAYRATRTWDPQQHKLWRLDEAKNFVGSV